MPNHLEDEMRKRAAEHAWEAAHAMPVLAKRLILTVVVIGFAFWSMSQDQIIPVAFTLPLCVLMLVGTWITPKKWFYWDGA